MRTRAPLISLAAIVLCTAALAACPAESRGSYVNAAAEFHLNGNGKTDNYAPECQVPGIQQRPLHPERTPGDVDHQRQFRRVQWLRVLPDGSSENCFRFVPFVVPTDCRWWRQDDRDFNRRIGPYRIDECLIDNRGGTYFRTYSGGDGIGPDVMSYGFCYNPNRDGTPFGAANYRTFQLGKEWYWFRASGDWF